MEPKEQRKVDDFIVFAMFEDLRGGFAAQGDQESGRLLAAIER